MQLLLAPALSRGGVDGGMEWSGKTPLSTPVLLANKSTKRLTLFLLLSLHFR